MSRQHRIFQCSTLTVSTLLLAGLMAAGCSRSHNAAQPAANQPEAVSSPANPATEGQNEAIAAAQAMRQSGNNGAPQQAQLQTRPMPAPAPQYVDVPAGTEMSIRLNRTLNVKTAQAGDTFTGVTAAPVYVHGAAIIPRDADVEGVIAAARRRGRFKGRSVLELRLIAVTLHGQRYPLNTRDYVRTRKGKGKRTAALIGGGSGLGMLIGGIATGGTGLLIGGLAGAGAGTAGAAFTGNRDIVVPAESILHFRLADALHIQR